MDKAKVEAKKKVVEDKTFGLKNKNKSSKVQKHIQQLHSTVDPNAKAKTQMADAKKEKKKQQEEYQKELDSLFKAAFKQPKIPVGVDPKSIICEAFRHGQCTKGFKCKFSHDLNVARKGPKIDLYTDRRDDEKEETMENWDQDKLEDVVQKKHGKENKENQTSIICKYFLEAVENKQYGWFWKCPNGDKCIYRHALPPGYILKSQMKELLEEEARKQRKDVSEAIEEERQSLAAGENITEETFRQWRAKKTQERKSKQEQAEAERKKKGILNGREIFSQQGFTAVDDSSAAETYEREKDEEDEILKCSADAEAKYKLAKEQAAAAGSMNTPTSGDAPSESQAPASSEPCSSTAAGPSTTLQLDEEDEQLFLEGDDEDDLDDDELAQLEEQVRSGT
ncbi:unnamed protein product [Ostreobium quekettii]|uniref:C3H1-type domain-containing protein n=1 Tax=Ostreobium quekettii TaxID=121088 RepID=A0A8S1J9Q3_9CHLO|nr:unnamed protein product [Ostreobium quekettii]